MVWFQLFNLFWLKCKIVPKFYLLPFQFFKFQILLIQLSVGFLLSITI